MARIPDIMLVGVLSLVVISTASFTLTTNKYFDLVNANTPASITITLLQSNCENCEILGELVSLIKDENVTVKTDVTEKFGSLESRNYVNKFNITKLPAVVVEGEVDKLSEDLVKIFDKRKDALVFETPIGFYFDVGTETVRGKVNVTYLTDSACENCYDVSIHDNALANVGVFISGRETYDISSPKGNQLVEKYNITKVPTIIITGDVKSYEGFDQIWDSVGTIENDGSYVFREMSQISGANYTELN